MKAYQCKCTEGVILIISEGAINSIAGASNKCIEHNFTPKNITEINDAVILFEVENIVYFFRDFKSPQGVGDGQKESD